MTVKPPADVYSILDDAQKMIHDRLCLGVKGVRPHKNDCWPQCVAAKQALEKDTA